MEWSGGVLSAGSVLSTGVITGEVVSCFTVSLSETTCREKSGEVFLLPWQRGRTLVYRGSYWPCEARMVLSSLGVFRYVVGEGG